MKKIDARILKKTISMMLLFLIIMGLFHAVYFHGGRFLKAQSVENANNVLVVEKDCVIEQDFIAEEEGIYDLTIDVAEFSPDLYADITMAIFEKKDDSVLYNDEFTIDSSNINGSFEVSFKNQPKGFLKLEKDNTYTFAIAIKSIEGGISFFLTNDGEDYHNIRIDGSEIPDTLCKKINFDLSEKYGKLFWYVAIPMVFFLTVIYVQTQASKYKIENIFLVAGVVLGIMIGIILPPGCVEDECAHLYSAMYYSERVEDIVLKERVDGAVYFRKGDIPVLQLLDNYDLSQKASPEYYEAFWSLYEPQINESEMVQAPPLGTYFVVAQTGNLLLYLPSAVGILLARLLHLGTIPMIYLARLFNLSAYLAFCYFAIRKIPFGKLTLSLIALLPSTLHMAASLNYDAINFGICAIFMGYLFFMIFKNDSFQKKDWKMLLLWSALLGFTKGGLYTILTLLSCMLLKKFRDKSGYKHIISLVTAAIGGLFINIILGKILFNVTYPLQHEAYYTSGASYGTTICYTVGDILSSPINTMIMMLRSILEKGGDWIMILCGKYYSWEAIQIPDIYAYMMILLIMASFFIKNMETESKLVITGYQKCVSIMTIVVFFGATMFMMLIAGTEKGNIMVHAIRARYFWPLLQLGTILVPNYKNENQEQIQGKILNLYILVVILAILRLFVQIMGVL